MLIGATGQSGVRAFGRLGRFEQVGCGQHATDHPGEIEVAHAGLEHRTAEGQQDRLGDRRSDFVTEGRSQPFGEVGADLVAQSLHVGVLGEQCGEGRLGELGFVAQCQTRLAQRGIDALGEVNVRVRWDDEPEGGDESRINPQSGGSRARVYHGHGAHTDVIVASAKAYLASLNRLLSVQQNSSARDDEAASEASA